MGDGEYALRFEATTLQLRLKPTKTHKNYPGRLIGIVKNL